MSNNSTPTIDQLKRGIAIAEQIQQLEAEMAAIFKGQPSAPSAPAVSHKAAKPEVRKKSKMSPEGRERIAAAQRARWAKVKSKAKAPAKAPAAAVVPAKKKRGITAAGRARLAALMKARWAARKHGAPAPNA